MTSLQSFSSHVELDDTMNNESFRKKSISKLLIHSDEEFYFHFDFIQTLQVIRDGCHDVI